MSEQKLRELVEAITEAWSLRCVDDRLAEDKDRMDIAEAEDRMFKLMVELDYNPVRNEWNMGRACLPDGVTVEVTGEPSQGFASSPQTAMNGEN